MPHQTVVLDPTWESILHIMTVDDLRVDYLVILDVISYLKLLYVFYNVSSDLNLDSFCTLNTTLSF